jgi:hypothetical protein
VVDRTAGSASLYTVPEEDARLKFEPDPRRQRRIAVARRVIIWSSIAAFAVAIGLLVMFRPGPLPVEDGDGGRAAVESLPFRAESTRQREFMPVRPRPLADKVRDEFGRVEQESGLAASVVQAIVAQLNAGGEPDLALVAARLDSARKALQRMQEAENALAALQDQAAGSSRYRFSVLQVASEKLRKLLAEQVRDGSTMLEALRAAQLARAAGETADAEIQQDIATSYLRQAENRVRRAQRQARAAREASAELLRAGVE